MLTYNYDAPPNFSGPSYVTQSEPFSVDIDASRIQQPGTYQFVVDGVSQSWVSFTDYTAALTKTYTSTGGHQFKANVKDKFGTQTTTSTLSVTVTSCGTPVCPK
jgi:hypothetical protein